MKPLMLRIGAVAAIGLLAGCSAMPGRTRMLGNVDYQAALATSRAILSQHFDIARTDPDTGEILCQPQPFEAGGDRLLGGSSPARRVATLNLRREDGAIVAHLAIAVQRQGSDIIRTQRDNYSSVPNQTPAEVEGATTPQQNQAWRTDRYDHAMEAGILDEIFQALHPGSMAQPASRPASRPAP